MSETASTGEGVAAYDSAKSSPARSGFLAFPTNSRRELTPVTRREIVKKSRALEANFPFLTRVHRKCARHAVGSGIHFSCTSDDEAFNDGMKRSVEEWWNNPAVYSIDGSVDGWEAKRLAVETLLLDGEYNAVFAYHPESGFPCLQPLDVFEIETPSMGSLPAGAVFNPREWDDGVRINEFERPIEYAVRSLPRLVGDAQRNYRLIPSSAMVRLGRRRRAHGHRFLPAAYSGLNQGIDALDLNALITGTAKLHSALAVTVKGTAKRNKKGGIGAIKNLNGSTGNDTDTAALEKVFGGGLINYLGDSGEVSLLSSQHPGTNVMEFRKVLLREMAIGHDLPLSVMWDMSEAGGTAVRYDAEDAQGTFDLLTDLVAWRFVRREIIWFVSWMVNNKRLSPSKDPLWFSKLVFRGPRKITVDVGRMATAFKTLTRNAGMSTPRYYEEMGLNPMEEMKSHIRFLRDVKAECEAAKVPFDLVMEPTPGVQNNFNIPQPDA